LEAEAWYSGRNCNHGFWSWSVVARIIGCTVVLLLILLWVLLMLLLLLLLFAMLVTVLEVTSTATIEVSTAAVSARSIGSYTPTDCYNKLARIILR
jgi:uncharacterized membrane protein